MVGMLRLFVALLCWFSFCVPAYAQNPAEGSDTERFRISWRDYLQTGSSDELPKLGNDILGDQINPKTGSLNFEHVDVSLPGNSKLPVEVRRRRVAGPSKGGWLADWQLLVPMIHTRIPVDAVYQNKSWGKLRCSSSMGETLPSILRTGYSPNVPLRNDMYSAGVFLDVPGNGSQHILDGSTWSDEATKVTVEGWYFTCLSDVDGEGTEGFVGHSPNGDKYVFDVIPPVVRSGDFMESWKFQVVGNTSQTTFSQDEYTFNTHRVLVSQVTDRDGNWVKYEYNETGRPVKIYSDDGRSIDFNGSDYTITEAIVNKDTEEERVWRYTTASTTEREFNRRISANRPSDVNESYSVLEKVELPNGTFWEFDMAGMNAKAVPGNKYFNAGGYLNVECKQFPKTVTVKHPSGLVGSFELAETRLKIANGLIPGADEQCPWQGLGALSQLGVNGTAGWTDVMAVQSKTLQDPLGDDLIWSYQYRSLQSGIEDNIWTRVTAPDGSVRKFNYRLPYIYGDSTFAGVLLSEELFESEDATSPIETTQYDYVSEVGVGTSFMNNLPDSVYEPIHKSENVITRGSDTYTTEIDYNLDRAQSDYSYGNPVEFREFNSVNNITRKTEIEYKHEVDDWVLGLPRKVWVADRLIDSYDYYSDKKWRVQYYNKFGVRQDTYSYHSDGTVSAVVDVLGNQHLFDNYKRGKPQSITLPDTDDEGNWIKVYRSVDDNGWIKDETNGRGYTTSYTYNELGWLETVTPPSEVGTTSAPTIINYTYFPDVNSPERLEQVITHGDYRVTRYLDVKQRMYQMVREDIADVESRIYQSFKYDYDNLLVFGSYAEGSLALSEVNGVETIYDPLRRIKETVADLSATEQAITKFEYLSGNRIQVTDAEDNITTTTFRTYGAPVNGMPDGGSKTILPIFVDAPMGADFKFEYDAWGNKRFQHQVNPNNVNEYLSTTEYSYNARNLLQWMKDPAGDTNYTWYDNKDRPIVTQNGEGRRTRTVYDEMDRPFKLIKAWVGDNAGNGQWDCVAMREAYDPVNYLQQCYQTNTYDANGNLETITDAKGNVTSYTYDALDRGKRVTYPDNSYTEVQNYDVFGNPLKARTRAGQIHDFAFDALSRMVASSTPDRDSAYQYDAADRRLCGAVYNAGQLGDLNIANDHCTNDNTGLQHRTSYAYDVAGRMTAETSLMAGGASLGVGYQYDKLNNRTRITWPDNYFVDYKYDELSRLYDVMENGSARLAYYDYDDQSRLECIINGGGTDCNSPTVSSSKLGWQIDSDLASLKHIFANDNDVEFGYDYDKSAKLIMEKVAVGSADWLHMPTQARNDNYGTANELNQYEAIDGVSVSHDLNGNRTGYDGLATPHDSENRLLSAGGATYKYDADGRRVAKVSSTTQRFVHAGDMEIAEYDGSSLLCRYIPGHSVDQRVAMIENNGSNTKHFYHANRLGSVQALVNTSGSVADKYVYTPFGIEEPLSESGNPFRYTGRKYDVESNLYYYRARYYDPEMGRFLETDPVGYADQMNMYTYVANDPLTFVDPSGAIRCVGDKDYCDRVRIEAERTSNEAENLANRLDDLVEGLGDEDLSDLQKEAFDAFEEVFGEGTATKKNVRKVARDARAVSKALSKKSKQKIRQGNNKRNRFSKRVPRGYVDTEGRINLNDIFWEDDVSGRSISLFHEGHHAVTGGTHYSQESFTSGAGYRVRANYDYKHRIRSRGYGLGLGSSVIELKIQDAGFADEIYRVLGQ